MILTCHVTSREHMFKVLYEFKGGGEPLITDHRLAFLVPVGQM